LRGGIGCCKTTFLLSHPVDIPQTHAFQKKQHADRIKKEKKMSDFQGFPPEACTFFIELQEQNNKTYWDAHKTVWEQKVHEPMEDFLAALEEEFPPFRLFRPYNDMRFSKDKSPYKVWTGATSETNEGKGLGLYVRLGVTGLMVASGSHKMERDQLERFHSALDHEVYGPQFEQIVHTLEQHALPVTGGHDAPLKTVPSGYAKDHPRADYLRWKGAVAIKDFGTPDWLHTPQAIEKVTEVWRQAQPLKDWLYTHVGPSQQSRERSAPRSRKTAVPLGR
jgi:uncharacterized protein (TIGR02453 family)